MAAETYGFYNNSPFFSLIEGFSSQKTTVVARYPNTDVVASGWLKGEELMAGRAAVVSMEHESRDASSCSACARSTARRRTRRSRCCSTRSIWQPISFTVARPWLFPA